MTKRLRDGPVMLQVKRPCLALPSLKRKRESVDEFVRHFKPRAPPRGTKRAADGFDQELGRLEKRMRATVPTAEEAIAFLVPHITTLRGLYTTERARVAELEANHAVMRRTCVQLLQERKRLQSALELAQYRASLNGTKPYDAWPTE